MFLNRRQLESFSMDKDFEEPSMLVGQTSFPVMAHAPSGYGFSEMESETSSRDSDSSHESRGNVRRRRKFVPMRDDDPDAEPLLQLRIIVMVCVYLGPLFTGFWTGLVLVRSLERNDDDDALVGGGGKRSGASSSSSSSAAEADFSMSVPHLSHHLIFLGGTLASVTLTVLLRFGRLRLLALASFLQFLSSVFLMFGSAEWMDRLVEVVTGVAVGIHIPVHQLVTAETCLPRHRSCLSLVSYLLLSLGLLVASLASSVFDVHGLAVLNVIGVAFHFVAAGFFHPETPRHLFAADRKRACAVSIQWLRGYRADIGAEFSLMADTLGRMETLAAGQSIFDTLVHRSVYQPVLTGVALLILTALSGFLPLSILLTTDFALSTSTASPIMATVILALGLAGPFLCLVAVRRTGKKILLLVSTAAMTAAALFLALLSHFEDLGVPAAFDLEYGSAIPAAAVIAFVFAFQIGLGPLSWISSLELVPCRALPEGVALAATFWWIFNLVFSSTLSNLYDAIGLSGLCWMSALVSALAYGFVLELVPDVREASLEDIETLFADTARFKRFNWKGDDGSEDEESVI